MINYMNTLNLSVDNALTSQQIIHQLITKINQIVNEINDLNIDFMDDAKKYTDTEIQKLNNKITKTFNDISNELNKLDLKITSEINTAINKNKDYTDIKVEELNEQIKTLNTHIDTAIEDCKEYTDKNISILNRNIELLKLQLEELAKNSFSSVSMLDGKTKANTECFYDMLHTFQRGHSVTLDQIIDWFTFFIPSNSPFDAEIQPTTLDQMLHYANDDYWNTRYNPIPKIDEEKPLTTIYNACKIKPTWGNITSIGLSAIGSLSRLARGPATGGTDYYVLAIQTMHMASTGKVANSSDIFMYNIMGTLDESFEFKKLG